MRPLRIRVTQRVEGIEESLDALNALVMRSRKQLARGNFPSVLDPRAGIRYRREPRGVENWQTARELFAAGIGDCEDLATVRVAELLNAGEDARVILRTVRPGLVHILVKRGDGSVEDPSKLLGMKGKG